MKKENGGDTLFKKKQVLVVVSIAITCFLIGSMFNVMASDSSGSPWDKVWTTISELQDRVQTLNESMPKKPEIITIFAYPDIEYFTVKDTWLEMLSLSDVTVPQDADVIVLFSANILGEHFELRHRVDTTHSVSIKKRYDNTDWEITEVHHVWKNLVAGCYNFSIQCYIPSYIKDMYVSDARLTLIVF